MLMLSRDEEVSMAPCLKQKKSHFQIVGPLSEILVAPMPGKLALLPKFYTQPPKINAKHGVYKLPQNLIIDPLESRIIGPLVKKNIFF